MPTYTFTAKGLVKRIATEKSVSPKVAHKVLVGIAEALDRGEAVKVPGYGTFVVKGKKKKSKNRNFRSGRIILDPPQTPKVPKSLIKSVVAKVSAS